MADSFIFRDLAYVFVGAVVGGLAARRLRQPAILGYVLAGIVVGPFTPGPQVSEMHILELFAEIGVIFLMYSIGIEFSPKDLLAVKWVSVGGGTLGIFAILGMGIAIGWLAGWPLTQSIAIGAAVSLASTMVLSRLLLDRGELHSTHGRAMIGITLVDDLAFVVMTILLPALTAMTATRFYSIAIAFGKALVILLPVGFVAMKIVPRIMAAVARIGSQELFVLVALGLGFATAAATHALGLSLALGAFLAGMVISNTGSARETLNHLLPFRDAFVALFFVTIGALVDPRALFSNASLLLLILGMVVVGKLVIWTAVVRLFRYPIWTALLVAAGLTQIGEFSYVLVQIARDARLIAPGVYGATLAASLLSIVANSFLVRAMAKWTAKGRREPSLAAKPG
jgi:CPA2 family monovalent cation:H+ antiporter-2